MAELVLSASSVDAYQNCHYRWYLAYVETRPGEQNIPAAIGLGVHAAVEDHYKTRLRGEEAVLATALDVFDTTFVLEAAGISEPSEDPVKARAIGRRVTTAYIEDVAPSIEPMLVEEAGEMDVNGIGYSVHIDLVDADGNVRDLKVKGSKPRYPTVYAFQLNGYALFYRYLTGKVEKDVMLDIMIRLKRDRPYLVQISNGGPVTKYALGLFAARLEETAVGIDKGDYSPTGLETGACRYCPFAANDCVYYAAMEARNA